jgi:hypothetical protein
VGRNRKPLLRAATLGLVVELSAQLATHGFRPHRRRTPGHIHTERYW